MQDPVATGPVAKPAAPPAGIAAPGLTPAPVPVPPAAQRTAALRDRATGTPAPTAAPADRPVPAGGPELPPAVRDSVGRMKLQMVVYSDVPAQRFIFIDNQKYVEGSSIDGKLVVEAITPDGAILNYQGTRVPLRQ